MWDIARKCSVGVMQSVDMLMSLLVYEACAKPLLYAVGIAQTLQMPYANSEVTGRTAWIQKQIYLDI